MPEDYITRQEHSEFEKRIDQENARQNKRIDELEKVVKTLSDLPITVKQIVANQEKQEKILEDIRNKPIEKVNTAWQSIINSICSTLGSAIVAGIIALIVFGAMK